MATSCKLNTSNRIQICSNCEHFEKKPFSIGCALQKWIIESGYEIFFYDPEKIYWGENLISVYNHELWENGVLCDKYEGDTWILKDMSCQANKEMVRLSDGRNMSVGETCIQYTMHIIDVDQMMTNSIDVTLQFTEGNNTNLQKWFSEIFLM